MKSKHGVQRRVPASVRQRGSSVDSLSAMEASVPVPPAELPVGGGRAAVTQLIVGGASGLAAVALGGVLALLPLASGGFTGELQPGALVPVLPILMVLLLQGLAILGTIVPAVRFGRMVRWSTIDAEAAPVPAWLARVGAAGLWVLVVAGLLVGPFGWFFLG